MVLLASNMYVKTFRINRNKQVIKLLDKPSDKLTIHFFFEGRQYTSIVSMRYRATAVRPAARS
jgi:hypothetical protein